MSAKFLKNLSDSSLIIIKLSLFDILTFLISNSSLFIKIVVHESFM